MKKIVIALATFITSIGFSYAQHSTGCTVKVTIPQEKVDRFKGQYLYVKINNPVDSIKEPIVLDSAKIENTLTTIKGLKPKPGSLNIAYITTNKKLSYPVEFIIEDGVVNIDMYKDGSVSGTPINDAILSYNSIKGKIIKEARRQLAALADTLKTIKNPEERDALQEKIIVPAQEKLAANAKKFFEKHRNDAVGLQALRNLLGMQDSIAAQRALIASAGDLVRSQKLIVEFLESLENLEATQEGCPFRDFSGQNDKGETVKLSDYVGNGHYTLVDFWASWCGPCRAEIPNLVKIYKDYKDKGLQVVGVAVWDKMPDHLEAVKQLGIKYPQILSEKEAANLYGINGIPQIILFAPNGTIVKRDLRGVDIMKLVAEKMNKK